MTMPTPSPHRGTPRPRTRRWLRLATVPAALALLAGTAGAFDAGAATTAAGAATAGTPSSTAGWPTSTGSVKLSSTVTVTGTMDGGNRTYYGLGDGGQSESQPPLFTIKDGGTLQNVILGTPAGDGVHCLGSCTLRNVWWLDVGEDAATFKGTSSSTRVLVDGGGARHASDKVFQHNGGGTVTVQHFQVQDFGKLYRSCGNCRTQYRRTFVASDVRAVSPGKVLAGVNVNYGDTATFSRITLVGSPKIAVCWRYQGNSTGAEPTRTGSGADGTSCRYSASDITYG